MSSVLRTAGAIFWIFVWIISLHAQNSELQLGWGFSCTSGTVTGHKTLASSSSAAPGGNVGIGFAAKLLTSHYKFYVESRYHYTTNKFITTQIIPVTVGIRF